MNILQKDVNTMCLKMLLNNQSKVKSFSRNYKGDWWLRKNKEYDVVGKSRIRKEVYKISIPNPFYKRKHDKKKRKFESRVSEKKYVLDGVFLRCPTGRFPTLLEAKGKSFGYFGQCVKSHKSFLVLFFFVKQANDWYQ